MSRSAVGNSHRHVIINVPMRLVAQLGDVLVSAEFHYTTRDPFAVQATFCRKGFSAVVWTFARDLLVVGLARTAGVGDVQVSPEGSSIVLSLSSPEGTAQLAAPAEDVRRFVSRMLSLVPAGDEAKYIDFDSELAALTAAISAGGDS